MTADPAPQGRQTEPASRDVPSSAARVPLYSRLLGLRRLRLLPWQRAVLGEGSLAVAGLLVLADLATAWTLLVLPLAVAALVKLHDVVAGLLATSDRR